jgi:Mannosyltransferase (PIG-V)
VDTASESIEPFPDPIELSGYNELTSTPAATVVEEPMQLTRERRRSRRRRLSGAARQELLWITVVYLAARAALLLVAYLNGAFGHYNFLHELANWDGLWYRELANNGYPTHVSYLQTTLGFFPLFPITIWLLDPVFTVLTGHNAIWASSVAGILISGAGGLVATILVHRLADGWWGRDVARRATILFCLFPGAVVFSMVYSEGLLLPLVAGCIYALERRRWVLAGVLAGIGTAVQPVALVLVFVCLSSSLLELHRRGWRTPAARRSLIAPVLSLSGAAAFALFLWAWTGNPFANYIAQHHGWSEKTDPLALVHLTTKLANEISFSHLDQPSVNLNLVVGLIGAVLLIVMLALLLHSRREVSIEAIVWTLGISFFAFTSEYVPPNPRLIFTAFPAVMVVARYAKGKWFTVIAWTCGLLFIGLSLLTFSGTPGPLRP